MKKRLFVILLGLLTGCATPFIDRTYKAVGQDSRAQFLILHYTHVDFPTSLKLLTEGEVSSHYLVNNSPPTIYQLVDENRRAYHAGVSYWKGATHLNASSIGIEIVNRGYDETPNGRVWYDYPQAQIDQVIALVKKIVKEHDIKPERILGHSDIAPGRKVDPGPRFPWKQLADAGLIPWPDANLVDAKKALHAQQLPDVAWFQQKLDQHGFAVPRNGQLDKRTQDTLSAFQMKYRQSLFDGVPDAETAALLDALTSTDEIKPK
ncbi:MAG: N-acetylmuramoyl-L-alanine amidase [Burkholderiales bacterium]|nr:N-acetylmuramoyl-L-alanine amidase [Burkholderiales bacterium]